MENSIQFWSSYQWTSSPDSPRIHLSKTYGILLMFPVHRELYFLFWIHFNYGILSLCFCLLTLPVVSWYFMCFVFLGDRIFVWFYLNPFLSAIFCVLRSFFIWIPLALLILLVCICMFLLLVVLHIFVYYINVNCLCCLGGVFHAHCGCMYVCIYCVVVCMLCCVMVISINSVLCALYCAFSGFMIYIFTSVNIRWRMHCVH